MDPLAAAPEARRSRRLGYRCRAGAMLQRVADLVEGERDRAGAGQSERRLAGQHRPLGDPLWDAATGPEPCLGTPDTPDTSRWGLAVRKSVPGDRRVRAVEITPKGLELFDAAHVAAEPLAERLVSELGPGEAEQLTDLLTRFTSHAEE